MIDLIIVAFLILVLISIILIYNSLIDKKNQVDKMASSVEVMLKKRFDLIPNIVNTVKAFMKHEVEVLTKLTQIRAKAINQRLTPEQRVAIDTQIVSALSELKITVEDYPELKTSTSFIQLQRSLNEAEEQISASRRAYNAAVTSLNNAIEMIPTNIFAHYMKIKPRSLYEIPVNEREKAESNLTELVK